MGSFLNLVYDQWDSNEEHPKPNGVKLFGENRFRGMTGLFHYYGFSDYKWYSINEVSNHPNEPFFYFVNHIVDLSELLKSNGDLPITPEAKKCYKENENFYILFVNEHEFERKEIFHSLETHLDKNKMPHDRIFLINNNARLLEYKNELGSKIKTHSIEYLPTKSANECIQYETSFVGEKDGHFFLNYNRTPKSHRYALLSLLMKNNILHDVDWSLIMGWYHRRNMSENHDIMNYFFDDILTQNDMKFLTKEIDYFNGIDIKKTKFEVEYDWFDDRGDHAFIDWYKVYETKSYESTYANIITESGYKTNEIHITEKSFRPFYFFQFPLFLASPNHMNELRNRYDFDMFDDVIDHSYDSIENHRDRMIAFVREIIRINNNKESLKQFYIENKDRFVENQNKIKILGQNKKDLNFFKSLIKILE